MKEKGGNGKWCDSGETDGSRFKQVLENEDRTVW